VQPVQPTRHPGAGLVEVGHRRRRQLGAHRVDEAVQPLGALGQDRGHGAAGHLGADQVGQRLGGALDRQVLLAVQVADRGADPGTVAGRGAHPIGEPRGRHRPTATAAPLGPMLGDQQAKPWQVMDLPGLDAHHPGVGQLAAAALAALGGVHHDHVRMLNLGQVRAGSAGLAAGFTPGGGAAGRPVGLGRALGQPVSRRRLGGVGGIGPQPGLQLHDLRVEPADARLKGGDDRVPGDELGPQPGDGGPSSRVRRSRRRIVRHADADRAPRPPGPPCPPVAGRHWHRPKQRVNQLCADAGASKAFSQDNHPYADATGAPTPTTMWLLHTLHDSALQPWHRGLIAARGRSRTNQTARAGAATG
jgi:hypothetical protein